MPSQSFRREIACKSLDREREKERGPQTCGINAHAHTQTQKETLEEIIYEYNSNWLSNIHYFFISTYNREDLPTFMRDSRLIR